MTPQPLADSPTASAYLLDVTRSLRRAGRLPTGVDRVERAYLRALLDQDQPVFGLVRTRLGYLLLDRVGLQHFLDRLEGRLPWGRLGALALIGRGDSVRRRAESSLRRDAMARGVPRRLPAMLARRLPQGVSYVNVGHSNLTDRVLQAVKAQGARVVVLLHDLIPLTHPETQRPETAERFASKVERVRKHSDLILCNSIATEAEVVTHMAKSGAVPPCLVAPLGVEMQDAVAEPFEMPDGFDPAIPYVIILGTIEPRKNHVMLLDIWDQLIAEGVPLQLVICGQRGWISAAVMDRLDQVRDRGVPVFELPGLSDGEIAHVMEGAAALLFPSLAEGYGLPAIEARARGCPVICSDLPVFREVLGNNAVYLPVNDQYSWTIKMTELAHPPQADPHLNRSELARFVPPSWQEHFNVVLRRL